MAPRLYQLDTKRLNTCSCTVPSDGEYPREAVFHKDCRFNADSKRPVELDCPLVFDRLVQNFFRSRQPLVSRHVIDGCAEALCGQGCQAHGMEAREVAFRPKPDTDRSILADFTDGPPKGKEFFSGYNDAGLFEEVLRKPSPAEYRRDKDARFFQPHTKTARYSKVLDHCFTQLSEKPCRWRSDTLHRP